MADFKTHIATSTVVGIGYGVAGATVLDLPLATCVLGSGLCGVSGMLPDLDSDSGVPLRESVAFAAAFVPMMLVERFREMGLTSETIVLIGGLMYLTVRFGMAWILKRFTVHRGMFHSLPCGVIFALLTFLIASGHLHARYFKAGGVILGFLIHLMLDELYSIEWSAGRLRLKRSFGTAMKFFSGKFFPDLVTYVQLLIVGFIVVNDPVWLELDKPRPKDEGPKLRDVIEYVSRKYDDTQLK